MVCYRIIFTAVLLLINEGVTSRSFGFDLYKCGIFPRTRKVFTTDWNCETLNIADQYCKGLCISHTYPIIIERSHNRNNRKRPKQQLYMMTSNNCPACEPVTYEYRKYNVSCRKRIVRRITNFRALFLPDWETYKKEVEVNLVKSCRCLPRTCTQVHASTMRGKS